MDICKLAVKKFANAIMERVRVFRLDGKDFAKPIPSRAEVERIVGSYIDDVEKFKKCIWNPTAIDVPYSSSEALFMAQPSAFSVDIIDGYFSGGEDCPTSLDSMIENVISDAISIAMCRTHNLWDRSDDPNNMVFEFKGTELEEGIRKTYGNLKPGEEPHKGNAFGV